MPRPAAVSPDQVEALLLLLQLLRAGPPGCSCGEQEPPAEDPRYDPLSDPLDEPFPEELS